MRILTGKTARQLLMARFQSKERYIYFTTECKVWLKKYLASREDNCRALFVTDTHPSRRMAIPTIRWALKQLAGRGELKVNLYPHRFRHTYACQLLDNGAPLDLIQFFPSLLEDKDNRKQLITVDHLLCMLAGFDWPELGELNGWPQMIHSPNWVKYILARPLVSDPGVSMNYNSGCSHLLVSILNKVSGKTTKEFAIKHLFSHLEISDFIWHEDPQGVHIGGFGLHMKISDMHKFGLLYLRKGKWRTQQLLNEDWIDFTTKPNPLTYKQFGHYGRHWWAWERSSEQNVYFAMGMGGQYICICIDSSRDTVIALTCDSYSDTLKPLNAIQELLM